MLVGLRPRVPSVPLKITSAISPPRKALADCSPSTHRMASEILDFPQPLGPTTAVIPGSKFRIVLSANDLNPTAFRLFRYMKNSFYPQNCGHRDSPVNLLLGQVDLRVSYPQSPVLRAGLNRLIPLGTEQQHCCPS